MKTSLIFTIVALAGLSAAAPVKREKPTMPSKVADAKKPEMPKKERKPLAPVPPKKRFVPISPPSSPVTSVDYEDYEEPEVPKSRTWPGYRGYQADYSDEEDETPKKPEYSEDVEYDVPVVPYPDYNEILEEGYGDEMMPYYDSGYGNKGRCPGGKCYGTPVEPKKCVGKKCPPEPEKPKIPCKGPKCFKPSPEIPPELGRYEADITSMKFIIKSELNNAETKITRKVESIMRDWMPKRY